MHASLTNPSYSPCITLFVLSQFGDIVTFMNLDATGFSDGGGLSMGVSPVADCLPKVMRIHARWSSCLLHLCAGESESQTVCVCA